MATIQDYFRRMKEVGASDLHMLSGFPPKFRIHGELEPIPGEAPIAEADLREILFAILAPAQKEKFTASHDLDFAYSLQGVARFRCNYLRQMTGLGAVFRIIPEKIKSIAELNLPK